MKLGEAKILFLLIITFFIQKGFCQEFISSQPDIITMSGNPSMITATQAGNILLMYRNNWPGNNYGFNNYGLLGGWYFEGISSGIGLEVSRESISQQSIQSTRFIAKYAYSVRLNRGITSNFGLNAGVKTMNNRFATLSTEIPEILPDKKGTDLQVGAGISVVNKYFITGVAFNLFPVSSYPSNFGSTSNSHFFTGHIQGVFNINKNKRSEYNILLIPTVIYQNYSVFNQITAGCGFRLSDLTAGVYLRNGLSMNTVMIFLIGYESEQYKISYSYDSKSLGFGINNINSGAHEVTFLYKLQYKRARKGEVPCPEIYKF